MISKLLAPALLAALLGVPAAAQAPQQPTARTVAAAPTAEFPATPAGQGARALFDAINSGDVAQRDAWIARYLPDGGRGGTHAENRDFFATLYAQSGGLEVREVRVRENDIRVTARARRGDNVWARVYMSILPAGDRFAGVGVVRIADPSAPRYAWPEAMVSEAEAVEHIGRRARALSEEDRFSGVVLVAKGDRVIFHQAYGMADKSFGVANRLDTKFNLGSMNKMFTAIAIAQLVEQGKLKFTDTLASVLPEYPNQAFARKVTLHHLLTHTSGLQGDIFVPDLWRDRAGFRKPSDYFRLFAGEPLAFEPGQGWNYSNSGFVILGAVIEKVTGRSYFDYVRENIYARAGMTDSDSYEMTQVVPNLAVGYAYFGDDPLRMNARRNNWNFVPFMGSPAGGGYSTAPDLLKFAQALRGHRLLSPAMTETVTSGKVDGGPGYRYGYGFGTETHNGRELRGHSGGGPSSGINSDLEFFHDGSYTVVVMGNYDAPAAQNLSREIFTFLSRQ
jgi:D-alanyl-D-alanine carboxypeptidase